jgi:hypothetical protein
MKRELYQPEARIAGDSPEDTLLLKAMAAEARIYISSFGWCPSIKDVLLAYGVGEIIAIFLFRFSRTIAERDDELWVIVGDVPSAYLVTDGLAGPKAALAAYCELMNEWVNAVLAKGEMSRVFPIETQPTKENAHALKTRLDFLRERVLPSVPED